MCSRHYNPQPLTLWGVTRLNNSVGQRHRHQLGEKNNVLMKSKSLLIDMDELAKVEATAKDMHSHRTGKRLLLLTVNIARNYRRKSEMVLTSVLRDLQQQV